MNGRGRMPVFGIEASGLPLILLRLVSQAVRILPWLALALAYRHELPERLGRGRHVARAMMWGGVF